MTEVEAEYDKVKHSPAKATRILRSQQSKNTIVSSVDGIDGVKTILCQRINNEKKNSIHSTPNSF